MFATYDGQTTRPPVAWCANCLRFQIAAPYILCLTRDSIKVYGLDSKLKQDINLSEASAIKYVSGDDGDGEDMFLVSRRNQIYALYATSVHKQVDQLLAVRDVDEAMRLFENLVDPSLDRDTFNEVSSSLDSLRYVMYA